MVMRCGFIFANNKERFCLCWLNLEYPYHRVYLSSPCFVGWMDGWMWNAKKTTVNDKEMRYENFLPHNRLIINSGGIHKPTLKLCGGECWRDERAPGRSLLCFAYADEELLNWVSNELQVLNVSISGCGGVPVVFPSSTQQVGRTIGSVAPHVWGLPLNYGQKKRVARVTQCVVQSFICPD